MADEYINQVYTQATGTTSTSPFVTHFDTRNPNANDVNWPVQKLWFNTYNISLWILEGFTTTAGVVYAIWTDVASGSVAIETLTGNSGGAVGVDNHDNINVVGDGTTALTVGDPSTNTLTISTGGSVATTYTGDTGTATPSGGNLNVLGGVNIKVAASGDTLTINQTGSLSITFETNSGTASPEANIIHVVGTQGMSTTGATNVVTVVGTPTVAASSSDINNLGTASFNSTQFTADGNGWVSLANGVGFISITRQVFTDSGTYTPTSGMLYCDIEVVGGGGGSGGIASTGTGFGAASGGGGGGGYARGAFSATTVGASQSVSIGAGGTAAATGNNTGGTGGTTSVGSLISATGGVGGTGGRAVNSLNGYAAAGGLGGAGTGGDFQTNGTPGSPSVNVGFSVNCAGAGGSSYFGGGGQGGDWSPANPGVSYGGGASGVAQGQNLGTQPGGVGFAGVVVITEYVG